MGYYYLFFTLQFFIDALIWMCLVNPYCAILFLFQLGLDEMSRIIVWSVQMGVKLVEVEGGAIVQALSIHTLARVCESIMNASFLF